MDHKDETDITATLIEGAKRGDRAAQEALVKLYERRVYGLILRLVGNREDARDILQDTMIKALTGISSYDGSHHFSSWLLKIGANRSLDFLRRRKLETRLFVYEDDERGIDDLAGGAGPAGAGGAGAGGQMGDGDPMSQALAAKMDWAVVERCLADMKPKYRTVLHLRYKDDLAYDEIARVLSIPMGTVKVLLHRGRLELRKRVLADMGQSDAIKEVREQ
jgi:RNA polymerase sigma-70 factor (ECF subfamily)